MINWWYIQTILIFKKKVASRKNPENISITDGSENKDGIAGIPMNVEEHEKLKDGDGEEVNEDDEQKDDDGFSMGAFVQVVILFYQVNIFSY